MRHGCPLRKTEACLRSAAHCTAPAPMGGKAPTDETSFIRDKQARTGGRASRGLTHRRPARTPAPCDTTRRRCGHARPRRCHRDSVSGHSASSLPPNAHTNAPSPSNTTMRWLSQSHTRMWSVSGHTATPVGIREPRCAGALDHAHHRAVAVQHAHAVGIELRHDGVAARGHGEPYGPRSWPRAEADESFASAPDLPPPPNACWNSREVLSTLTRPRTRSVTSTRPSRGSIATPRGLMSVRMTRSGWPSRSSSCTRWVVVFAHHQLVARRHGNGPGFDSWPGADPSRPMVRSHRPVSPSSSTNRWLSQSGTITAPSLARTARLHGY